MDLNCETSMGPVRMEPAFRSGTMTPWGGTRLRELYGKNIPDDHTGESLELSCIPGLESRDGRGRTLPELIAEYGEKLVGRYADRPFPLLLKLIDAQRQLSVQVHPDDSYARIRENGKFGKSEAWLILDTPAGGGDLVYGVRPGVTAEEMREACEAGSEVEKLLNHVKVYPGDVCFIPAGCVHAIGRGIVLYEIQESSDVTYRFYDWNRVDQNGNRRELHLDKALDVADLGCSPMPLRTGKDPGLKRVLSAPCFTLDLIRTDSALELPGVTDFGILTALEGKPELHFAGGCRKMKAGETCLIPRSAPALTLAGTGAAALAMPV